MSTVERHDGETAAAAPSTAFDLKLEVVVIPVADADRSKAFYAGLGSSYSSGADPGWPDWYAEYPDWYAEYIVSEQTGRKPPA